MKNIGLYGNCQPDSFDGAGNDVLVFSWARASILCSIFVSHCLSRVRHSGPRC